MKVCISVATFASVALAYDSSWSMYKDQFVGSVHEFNALKVVVSIGGDISYCVETVAKYSEAQVEAWNKGLDEVCPSRLGWHHHNEGRQVFSSDLAKLEMTAKKCQALVLELEREEAVFDVGAALKQLMPKIKGCTKLKLFLWASKLGLDRAGEELSLLKAHDSVIRSMTCDFICDETFGQAFDEKKRLQWGWSHWTQGMKYKKIKDALKIEGTQAVYQ